MAASKTTISMMFTVFEFSLDNQETEGPGLAKLNGAVLPERAPSWQLTQPAIDKENIFISRHRFLYGSTTFDHVHIIINNINY